MLAKNVILPKTPVFVKHHPHIFSASIPSKFIEIVFIFVESPEVSIARIKERVKKGGHFVPDEDVRRRFDRGKKNFWQIYKNLADSWSLFYNSEGSFNQVAIGEKDDIFVIDQELFDKFEESLK